MDTRHITGISPFDSLEIKRLSIYSMIPLDNNNNTTITLPGKVSRSSSADLLKQVSYSFRPFQWTSNAVVVQELTAKIIGYVHHQKSQPSQLFNEHWSEEKRWPGHGEMVARDQTKVLQTLFMHPTKNCSINFFLGCKIREGFTIKKYSSTS